MKIKPLFVASVVIHVLLLLLGITIAALGIWVLAADYGIVQLGKIRENGYYSSNLDEPGLLDSAAVICIVAGGSSVILCIVVFIGLKFQSKCYMAVCAALLICLVFLDGIIIALTAVANGRTQEHLQGALLEGVANHYDDLIYSQFTFSVYYDRAQVQLECCGVVNYTDFKTMSKTWPQKAEFQIPRTCCAMNYKSSYLYLKEYDLQVVNCPINLLTSFDQSCHVPIKNWLTQKTLVLLVISAVIGCLKIAAIILDILVLRSLKEDSLYRGI